jgi:hypothetical protein
MVRHPNRVETGIAGESAGRPGQILPRTSLRVVTRVSLPVGKRTG